MIAGTCWLGRGQSVVAEVDIELSWGDERLAVSCHPIDRVLSPGGPFEPMCPLQTDGHDVLLTVPPRARAWIHTANGWRDLNTLRILECVGPHPELAGAAQIRMRRLSDADSLVQGVALVRRPEGWLEQDGWWLRVGLSEAVESVPRLDRRAVRGAAIFVAFVVSLFAGVVSAFGTVPPRLASLDLRRLESRTARLPPVHVDALDHPSSWAETKHRVPPRTAGGSTLADVEVAARPVPARRAMGSGPARAARAGRPAGEALAELAAAAAAVSRLSTRQSPFDRDQEAPAAVFDLAAPTGAQRLARGHGTSGADLSSVRSAALAGPLDRGWGSGLGRTRALHRRPVRARVIDHGYDIVPICDRIYLGPDGRYGCHRWTRGRESVLSFRQQIRAVVRAHLAELRFCYEEGRARRPELEGRLLLQWTIDADGTTSGVEIVEDALPDAIVAGCVRLAPEGWRFPEGMGPVRVRYPFSFRAL